MKYNKHYKAPRAASKKRNPDKKKTVQKRSKTSSKKMSTEDALLAQGVPGYVYPQVEDMRKDKSKSGTLAALSEIVIKNDQPKIFALVDSSAIKNPKPIKNATKAVKKEKTAEELEAETLKNIIANIDASQSGREKIMASVKLQSIGGQIMRLSRLARRRRKKLFLSLPEEARSTRTKRALRGTHSPICTLHLNPNLSFAEILEL
jgi:hypothetical protein